MRKIISGSGVWESYCEYLRSDDWYKKREYTIISRGRKCEGCGSAKKLQVHHTSYKNIGNEDQGDLVVLCEVCHKAVHSDGPVSSKVFRKVGKSCATTTWDKNRSIMEKLWSGSPNKKHFKALSVERFGRKLGEYLINEWERSHDDA